MALHLSQRPTEFSQLRGNKHSREMLEKILLKSKEERPHTYLFSGSRGCGKTTCARILARKFGGKDSITEINCANKNGVDDIRKIEEEIKYLPLMGNAKCYILDEAHELTPRAQNCTLKMTEDTPDHVYFFLCTTEPKKLKKTIRSRCTRITMTTIDDRDMTRLVVSTAASCGKTLKDEVVEQVITNAEGHPREALVLLDSIIDLDPDKQLEAAKKEQNFEAQVIELCRVVTRKGALWNSEKNKENSVVHIYQGLEADSEKIRYAMLGYFRNALLRSGKEKHAKVIELCSETTYATKDAGIVWMIYNIYNHFQGV